MSKKRLFRVELSAAIYVVAEDALAAEKYAKAVVTGEDAAGVEYDTFSRLVHAKFPVEPEWMEGLPYGDIPDSDVRSVGEHLRALQANAAEASG